VATSELTGTPTGRPDDIKAVPVRRPGRWIAAVILVIVAASLIDSAIANSSVSKNTGFQWPIVKQYLFDSRVLHGIVITIELTVTAMAIGIVLGVILAVMRLSPNPIVKTTSWLYIYFFRGTPVLVQIIFWGFFAALYKKITLGIPFGGPVLLSADSNQVITLFVAAMLGLGLNEGAYMAEIVRAGILSVPEGQTEAAQSLGMGRIPIMRRIVLPQAMRVIIPPTGNETISMLKTSSLAYAIGLAELTFESSQIYAVNFRPIPLLLVASLWYLLMTSVLYVAQYFIERRFGRGFSRAAQISIRERWLGFRRPEVMG
jgi:polar amino acid transport system permease protein